MRLDEIVTLNDVLNSTHYMKLVNGLKARGTSDINVTKIKNRVINSWQKGMKSRKHYDDLLGTIDLSLNDLIDK
jgi:aryl carrier-like protein